MLRTVFLTLIFASVSISVGLAQQPESDFSCGGSFTDTRDGKIYKTILIGNQCWMAENMNIGSIVSDLEQGDNQIIEKTCYGNDPTNCEVYGGLYTWHEATQWEQGEQGICPGGWRLPSKDDWQTLVSELGMDDAGQKMKVAKDHSPAWDGDNSSGFSAIPAGVGYQNHFGRISKWALFWSATQVDDDYAWFAQLDNYWYQAPPKYKILFIGDHFVKENGFSVRCVR